MNRNLSLQEKTEKLLSNSFHTLDQTIREGLHQISRDRYETFREEVIAIMEYFQNMKLYVLDLPANIVPHPENRRRLIDPELANTPASKTLVVNTERFENLYQLTERFNQLLGQNNEIFIYSIESVQVFDPMNFEPIYKPIVRFAYINLDYWYNPNYVQPVENVIQPEVYFDRYNRNRPTEDIKEEDKPISVGKSILKHKF